MRAIKLQGKDYPIGKTPEGEKLVKQLHVDVKRAEAGKNYELIRYGYCMVAGACKAAKKDFPFTVDAFRKAMPADWKSLFSELVNADDSLESESKKVKATEK